MKKLALSVTFAVISYFCSLQPGFSQTPQDSFLVRALEADATEIQLGKMAESKTQNPRVQSFAETMVKDHTNTLDALHRLATGGVSVVPNDNNGTDSAEMAIRIPLSKEHQELKDRLSQLSGDDFDREYMNAMVQEHRKDIKEFERVANAIPDSGNNSPDNTGQVREKPQPAAATEMTQARIIARDLLPVLKAHLQEAEAVQQEVGPAGIPNNTFGGEEHGAHMKTQ